MIFCSQGTVSRGLPPHDCVAPSAQSNLATETAFLLKERRASLAAETGFSGKDAVLFGVWKELGAGRQQPKDCSLPSAGLPQRANRHLWAAQSLVSTVSFDRATTLILQGSMLLP